MPANEAAERWPRRGGVDQGQPLPGGLRQNRRAPPEPRV